MRGGETEGGNGEWKEGGEPWNIENGLKKRESRGGGEVNEGMRLSHIKDHNRAKNLRLNCAIIENVVTFTSCLLLNHEAWGWKKRDAIEEVMKL